MSNITDGDIAALKALVQEWARINLEGDYSKLPETLSEDVVFMPTDFPVVEGRDAVRAFMEKFPRVKEFEPRIVDVDGRDDLACLRGTTNMTVEPEPGKPVRMTGKWLVTCRKQPDGRWLCVWDIWNFDKPQTAG
jgi:uncharacterized protein (TIGR02246 family)